MNIHSCVQNSRIPTARIRGRDGRYKAAYTKLKSLKVGPLAPRTQQSVGDSGGYYEGVIPVY